MDQSIPLVFKMATEDWEFDLIHQLNYKTFVEEIPQHQVSDTRRRVDPFHAENNYAICLSGRRLAGMLALRAKRPFSLDQKLENLDTFLPAGRSLCEIRLLSVDKKFRTGQVFQGLMAMVWQFFIEHGLDLALISGTTRQLKLYHHLGFIPFGPLVGAEGAQFQPMYLSIESFEAGVRDLLTSRSARSIQRPMVNFLPGPVTVSRQVRRAFEQPPESHRDAGFVKDLQATREALCQLTGAKHVEVLVGSGTLGNDVVAAQLSLEEKLGLIVTNGEFGDRLADHARRMRLNFELLEHPWGDPFDLSAIEQKLDGRPRAGWIWVTHCETSTGVVNNLAGLKALCADYGVKLCLDCISSIGTLPVNLEGVHLATCASGKGLRSFAGLSLVFYNHDLVPSVNRLPRYLDLEVYARNSGVPFTHSSNLVHALHAAIKRVDWSKRFADLQATSVWLRSSLRGLGFRLIGPDNETSPAVVTVALPTGHSSTELGGHLHEAGFQLSYNSEYLRQRNWLQICLMGEYSREKLVSLLNHMQRLGQRHRQVELSPNPPASSPPKPTAAEER